MPTGSDAGACRAVAMLILPGPGFLALLAGLVVAVPGVVLLQFAPDQQRRLIDPSAVGL